MSLFIEHFGKLLHQKVGKPEIACKGFIRLAIKDIAGDSSLLSIDQMHIVLQQGLKTRLEKINIENIDALIAEFEDELEKNKPLFTMASI